MYIGIMVLMYMYSVIRTHSILQLFARTLIKNFNIKDTLDVIN